MIWEDISPPDRHILRTKIPGGWLVLGDYHPPVVIPDPEGLWLNDQPAPATEAGPVTDPVPTPVSDPVPELTPKPTSTPSPSTYLVPSSPEPQLIRPFLGTNLMEIRDWLTDVPFSNFLYQRRKWISGNDSTWAWDDGRSVAEDEDGNIARLELNQIARGLIWTRERQAGTYELYIDKWDRRAQITGLGCNHRYNEQKRCIELEVPSNGNCGINIFRPPDGLAPKLLSLVPAGMSPAQTLNPDFVAKMSRYGCVRFMDWQQTNYDRPPESLLKDFGPDPSTFAKEGESVPLIVMTMLCNEAKVDGWFCIPAQAGIDYIRTFCSMLEANLAPGRRVYLEHSNEVWNGIFPQHRLLGSNFDQTMTAHIHRSSQIHTIAKEVLGDRVTTVLGGFAASPWWTGEFRRRYSSLVIPRPDVIAIAPYITDLPDDPVVFENGEAESAVTRALSIVAQHISEASGWPIVSYESGMHVVPGINLSRDSRIENVYNQYFRGWAGLTNNSLICHFSHIGVYDRSGSWGEKETFWAPETGKSRAIRNLLGI